MLRVRWCAAAVTVPSALCFCQRAAFSCSTLCLRGAHQRRRAASGSLWDSHGPPSSTTAAAAAAARPLRLPTAATAATQRAATPKPFSSSLSSQASAPPPQEAETDRSSSFLLDPPFTPILGEAHVAPGTSCVYTCRSCRSPLFHSSDLLEGSAVGDHRSGWPTFVAPLSETCLHLRTVLQRSVVVHSAGHASPTTAASPASVVGEGLSGLQLRVPDAALSQRGLPVEGDMVRLRGRRIGPVHTQTWRETCLRDVNQRADPSLVVGCCAQCGAAVCRVVQSAATGSRFVTTASSVAAEGEEQRET